MKNQLVKIVNGSKVTQVEAKRTHASHYSANGITYSKLKQNPYLKKERYEAGKRLDIKI